MQARAADNIRNIHAFGTPTVIHFCSALLISAVMTAPWQSLASLGVCLTVLGVAGVAYSFRVFWHAREAAYKPDFEDWVWYLILPSLAHLALLSAAVPTWWNVTWPLTIVAAVSLVFLFIGVHNAWDTVTFIAVRHAQRKRRSEREGSTEQTTA